MKIDLTPEELSEILKRLGKPGNIEYIRTRPEPPEPAFKRSEEGLIYRIPESPGEKAGRRKEEIRVAFNGIFRFFDNLSISVDYSLKSLEYIVIVKER